MFLDQKYKLFDKQLFFWKIKNQLQNSAGGSRGRSPPVTEKRLWTKFIIYPRPKIVMKQVYMKATELKNNVVSFIFNFPLI